MVSPIAITSEHKAVSLRGTTMHQRFLRPETSDVEWIILSLSIVLFVGVASYGIYKFCYKERQKRLPPMQSIATPSSKDGRDVLDGDTSSVSDCSEMTDPASTPTSTAHDIDEEQGFHDPPLASKLQGGTVFGEPSNIVDSSMEVYGTLENDELDVSTDYSLNDIKNDSHRDRTPKSPESISSTSLYVTDPRSSPNRRTSHKTKVHQSSEMNTSGSDESDATGLWDYSVAGETTVTNTSTRIYNKASSVGAAHKFAQFNDSADLNESAETDDTLFSPGGNASVETDDALEDVSATRAESSVPAATVVTPHNSQLAEF